MEGTLIIIVISLIALVLEEIKKFIWKNKKDNESEE
jgi:hypothetical protein